LLGFMEQEVFIKTLFQVFEVKQACVGVIGFKLVGPCPDNWWHDCSGKSKQWLLVMPTKPLR